MSISFSSSLMLSPLPFAMKPSLVIRARVRKWRRFELVTTANHEADVIRSDNSRWMTVERKSLASTRNRFFLKVWNYDLIPLFWNGQTGIFIIFFYLFKVFTKNKALGRIPIVEEKVFTWLVKGPFIFPWNVIQNTPLRPLTTLVERLVFAHYPVHVRREFYQYCSILVFTCKNKKAHYNDFLIQG